jgi:hypothetical protein
LWQKKVVKTKAVLKQKLWQNESCVETKVVSVVAKKKCGKIKVVSLEHVKHG